MRKTVRISVMAKRKDGSVRYRGSNAIVSKRLLAPLIERHGAWGITPFYGSILGFKAGGYTVTHLPTGWTVLSGGRTLRECRRVMRWLASQPNQAAWKRLTNRSHLTNEMKAIGRQFREQFQ